VKGIHSGRLPCFIEFGYLADMPKIKRLKVPVKNPQFLTEDQTGIRRIR